jgi:hypothetical protein
MRRRTLLGGLACYPVIASAQPASGSPDLSRYTAGPLPSEWQTGWRTGTGALGSWSVVEDRSANGGKAIEQSNADATDYRFPLAVFQSLLATDVDASVRFKAVSGKGDRAGGLAVRLLDADNYYVVRANALEDNVNLYRVVKGRRQEIKGASAKVTSGEWHLLSLRAHGPSLTVSFDGKMLFTADDRTFPNPGRVALWTKADSVTRFDSLKIVSLLT